MINKKSLVTGNIFLTTRKYSGTGFTKKLISRVKTVKKVTENLAIN
jgi:hypothetical protein